MSVFLQRELIGNIFAFFEPRIALEHIDLDFTFFVSKIRDSQSGSPFSVAPLIKPFTIVNNKLYGGLNVFFGFGSMELDKMQGGFHGLIAMPITRPITMSLLALAITPFYTLNIGLCDLDLRCSIYPLLYATPASMFEGKIALKRNL